MKVIELISRYRVLFVILILVGGLIVLGIISPPSQKAVSQSDYDATNFSIGDENASVKLIQYSDFLCPSCSQVSLGIMPKIIDNYVDGGQVKFEFRPMAFIAAGSQVSAEGAFCAAEQNMFWEYHDQAYKEVWEGYFSKNISPYSVNLYSVRGVKNIAKTAGISAESFDKCLDNNDMKNTVVEATKKWQSEGVSGTPYFTVNGIPVNGVPSYEILEAAIKASL